MKKEMSLETFQRLLRNADTYYVKGLDNFITIVKNGKEKKVSIHYMQKHIQSIKEKYQPNID